MTLKNTLTSLLVAVLLPGLTAWAAQEGELFREELESGFLVPPQEAKTRCFWWWLNSNVTQAAITRDLEQLKAKGFGGVLLFDADGSSQDGNRRAPAGPAFLSPAWRELFRHAVPVGLMGRRSTHSRAWV